MCISNYYNILNESDDNEDRYCKSVVEIVCIGASLEGGFKLQKNQRY